MFDRMVIRTFDRTFDLIKGDLDAFKFEFSIFAKFKAARVFALELKLSKTLRGLVYFVLQL